jgi:hypothetical protein
MNRKASQRYPTALAQGCDYAQDKADTTATQKRDWKRMKKCHCTKVSIVLENN